MKSNKSVLGKYKVGTPLITLITFIASIFICTLSYGYIKSNMAYVVGVDKLYYSFLINGYNLENLDIQPGFYGILTKFFSIIIKVSNSGKVITCLWLISSLLLSLSAMIVCFTCQKIYKRDSLISIGISLIAVFGTPFSLAFTSETPYIIFIVSVCFLLFSIYHATTEKNLRLISIFLIAVFCCIATSIDKIFVFVIPFIMAYILINLRNNKSYIIDFFIFIITTVIVIFALSLYETNLSHYLYGGSYDVGLLNGTYKHLWYMIKLSRMQLLSLSEILVFFRTYFIKIFELGVFTFGVIYICLVDSFYSKRENKYVYILLQLGTFVVIAVDVFLNNIVDYSGYNSNVYILSSRFDISKYAGIVCILWISCLLLITQIKKISFDGIVTSAFVYLISVCYAYVTCFVFTYRTGLLDLYNCMKENSSILLSAIVTNNFVSFSIFYFVILILAMFVWRIFYYKYDSKVLFVAIIIFVLLNFTQGYGYIIKANSTNRDSDSFRKLFATVNSGFNDGDVIYFDIESDEKYVLGFDFPNVEFVNRMPDSEEFLLLSNRNMQLIGDSFDTSTVLYGSLDDNECIYVKGDYFRSIAESAGISLINHNQYFVSQHVSRCYSKLLGRTISSEELNYWVDSIVSENVSYVEFVNVILASEEFSNVDITTKANVRKIYDFFFDVNIYDSETRSITDEEYEYWLSLLDNGYSVVDGVNQLINGKSTIFDRLEW